MGWDDDFALAFLKSQISAGTKLPTGGTAFISLRESDKAPMLEAARRLIDMGFDLVATVGTAGFLAAHGIAVGQVKKVIEGKPNVTDDMINGQIDVVFNTTQGAQSRIDSKSIRRTAMLQNIPYFTTLAASRAAVNAIAALREQPLSVRSLQDAAKTPI